MREPDAGWRDRLTVIITTSPLPRHPCSSMLEAILLSLRGFGGLAGCRMLIVADGYEASAAEGQSARWKKGKISEEAAARYEQHKQRVRAACEAGAPPFEQAELISPHLPRKLIEQSEHVSPHLPTSPDISRHLHISPHLRMSHYTSSRRSWSSSSSTEASPWVCGAPYSLRARSSSSWCSTTAHCAGTPPWPR